MQPALPGTRHALDDRYTGPFIITELRDASAVLDDALSPLRSKPVVHLDQLKPCIPGMQALGEDWDGLINHGLNRRDPGNESSEDPADHPGGEEEEQQTLERAHDEHAAQEAASNANIPPPGGDDEGEISPPEGAEMFHGFRDDEILVAPTSMGLPEEDDAGKATPTPQLQEVGPAEGGNARERDEEGRGERFGRPKELTKPKS